MDAPAGGDLPAGDPPVEAPGACPAGKERCDKCEKVLAARSVRRHAKVCKGVPRNTCRVCHATFGYRQLLHIHKTKADCCPPVAVGGGGDEPQLHAFSREECEHITRDAARMDEYIKMCYTAIPSYVRDRFFDQQRPENCTVRMRNCRDGYVQVRNAQGEWDSKQKKEVLAELIYLAASDLGEHCDGAQCGLNQYGKDEFNRMMKTCHGAAPKRTLRSELEKRVVAVVLDNSRRMKSGPGAL
jgi:hypothetical protein